MTENGTFIINGTERVVVSQLHRSPGRLLRPRQGQEPLARASCSTTPASSPTAARGSTSSSTTRTCSTCASTGAGSCRRRCSSAPWAACPTPRRRTRSSSRAPPRRSSTTTTPPRPSTCTRQGRVREVGRARPAARPARHARHQEPQDRRGHRQEEPQVHPRRDQEARGGEDQDPADRRRGAVSPRSAAHDVVDEATGEVLLECNEEVSRGEARASCASAASRSSRSSSSTT